MALHGALKRLRHASMLSFDEMNTPCRCGTEVEYNGSELRCRIPYGDTGRHEDHVAPGDRGERRSRAARRHLPADRGRPLSGHSHLRSLRQGTLLPGGLPACSGSKMVADHPEILEGSTNKYQNWEVTDPERWIPHGYVVIRVDSRGAGWSPGVMNCNSPRETQDLYECIEWAGTQPWSNGKVGMLGISYYASNQWRVAAKHPPHLAAIIPWEGQNDRYRDSGYHGGILSQFQETLGKAPSGQHSVRQGRARQEKPQYRRVRSWPCHAL